MIEQILFKNLDAISFSYEKVDESSQMPKRHNVRGNRYFSWQTPIPMTQETIGKMKKMKLYGM